MNDRDLYLRYEDVLFDVTARGVSPNFALVMVAHRHNLSAEDRAAVGRYYNMRMARAEHLCELQEASHA